eukprot:gene12053-biopygen4738
MSLTRVNLRHDHGSGDKVAAHPIGSASPAERNGKAAFCGRQVALGSLDFSHRRIPNAMWPPTPSAKERYMLCVQGAGLVRASSSSRSRDGRRAGGDRPAHRSPQRRRRGAVAERT